MKDTIILGLINEMSECLRKIRERLEALTELQDHRGSFCYSKSFAENCPEAFKAVMDQVIVTDIMEECDNCIVHCMSGMFEKVGNPDSWDYWPRYLVSINQTSDGISVIWELDASK